VWGGGGGGCGGGVGWGGGGGGRGGVGGGGEGGGRGEEGGRGGEGEGGGGGGGGGGGVPQIWVVVPVGGYGAQGGVLSVGVQWWGGRAPWSGVGRHCGGKRVRQSLTGLAPR